MTSFSFISPKTIGTSIGVASPAIQARLATMLVATFSAVFRFSPFFPEGGRQTKSYLDQKTYLVEVDRSAHVTI